MTDGRTTLIRTFRRDSEPRVDWLAFSYHDADDALVDAEERFVSIEPLEPGLRAVVA